MVCIYIHKSYLLWDCHLCKCFQWHFQKHWWTVSTEVGWPEHWNSDRNRQGRDVSNLCLIPHGPRRGIVGTVYPISKFKSPEETLSSSLGLSTNSYTSNPKKGICQVQLQAAVPLVLSCFILNSGVIFHQIVPN